MHGMAFNSTDISVPARYSSLPGLIDALSRQAGDFGLAGLALQRLQLVVEELFANTINHGHGTECDQPVNVALHFADDQLTLRYSDGAPPFDIAENAGAEPSTAAIGGVGLALIHGMSRAVRYQRENDRNITEVDLA